MKSNDRKLKREATIPPALGFKPMEIPIWVKQEGELAIGVCLGEIFFGRLEGDDFQGDYQLHGESVTRARIVEGLHRGDGFHEAKVACGSQLYRALTDAIFSSGGNRKKSG